MDPQFKQQIAAIWSSVADGHKYPCSDCLSIFECFFAIYALYRGSEHPSLRNDQIRRIISLMPRDNEGNAVFEPADYPDMIVRYFNTEFPHCDYRINHFFTGAIRSNRYYESLRGRIC